MSAFSGSADIYERDGRRFIESGIGTIGWNVYQLYREVDFDGNVIESSPKPLEWIFPDPVAVAEQKKREEAERQRLERAARDFPVEGMSGEYDGEGGMKVWRSPIGDAFFFETRQCVLCDQETQCLYIEDDWVAHGVCRACLSKMFDAFEAHGVTA